MTAGSPSNAAKVLLIALAAVLLAVPAGPGSGPEERESAAWAAAGDRVDTRATEGCIDNVIPGGAPVCVSPQPEPPPPTMSPSPSPTPTPTESPAPAPPPPPPPPPPPGPTPSPSPSPRPRPTTSPSPTPSPTPTETPPAVDPVFPVPTPRGTQTVRPPELDPLGSGFSIFTPEGALVALLATLAALAVGGALVYLFRHSRMRAKQAKFDSKIFDAVQDTKEKIQLLGSPGGWTVKKAASG